MNRTIVNAAAIYIGEASSRLTTFVVAFIVARRFSPATFGQYGYAVAVASIVVLIPDMGLHLFSTQRVASDPKSFGSTFWDLHRLKLILLGGGVAFGLLIGELAIHDTTQRWLLYILALRAVTQSFSLACTSIFKAVERMHFVAIQQMGNGIATVTGLAICVMFNAGLLLTVSTLLAGQAIELLLGWVFIFRYFSPGPARQWNSSRLGPMFSAALPIGITALVQGFAIRTDVLVLGIFSSNEELGQFQTAAWLIVISFLGTSLLMAVLFPKLARLLRNTTPTGTAYLESLLKYGALLTILASITVWLGAPVLVQELFGRPLSPATSFLRIVAPAVPLVSMNASMFYVFVAINHRKHYLATLIFTTVLGVLCSLILAPRMGAAGIAVADLVREFVGSVIFLYLLDRESLLPSFGPALLKVVVGTASFALAGILVLGIGGSAQIWAIAWSLAMLGGILFVTGSPRLEQLMLLAREDL